MAATGWWRGLLARITLVYSFGALLLSTLVAVASFTIAQNRLLSTERDAALEQFIRNANIVRADLQNLPEDADEATKSEVYTALIENKVYRTTNRRPALILPTGDALGLRATELPSQIKQAVDEYKLADYLYEGPAEADGATHYVIGLEFTDLDYRYYEVRNLAELEDTLGSLRRILLATAAVASLAGAGLGFYSARRALAPVTRISNAAQAIAAGDFRTRLDLQVDPDLATLSESFNNMVDALEQRIRRDERFTSDVSHELRSPLMTLTASVEVLERRKGSLPEVAQRAVDLLRQDLTRFERLVTDLLEISRMDAGAVQLQLSHFGLAEFLVNVIAQSRSPEIELTTPDDDRDLAITADKRRLAQVVTNLIDNADKYGGGATGVRFRRVGDQVVIMVEDEGPGVPLEDRERIFDRFSRAGADAGRRSGDSGVGLGLSLVTEHVRLHGGRVWVTERTDGRSGARFVVELPVGEHEVGDEELAA